MGTGADTKRPQEKRRSFRPEKKRENKSKRGEYDDWETDEKSRSNIGCPLCYSHVVGVRQ